MFSQNLLKETIRFYENGNPEFVIYKNTDLQIVKEETYSPNGSLLAYYNYNPSTGKKDGPFNDLDNKGFYNEGLLNCDDYTFTIQELNGKGTGYFWNGKIVNGRPNGSVNVFLIKEDLEEVGEELDIEF